MTSEEFVNAINIVELKRHSVIFINQNKIDIHALTNIDWDMVRAPNDCLIVPVNHPPSLALFTREELQDALARLDDAH